MLLQSSDSFVGFLRRATRLPTGDQYFEMHSYFTDLVTVAAHI